MCTFTATGCSSRKAHSLGGSAVLSVEERAKVGSPAVAQVVKFMLQRDPAMRPGLAQVKQRLAAVL